MDQALPSSSSVRNYLAEIKHIEEGVADFDGLVQYLLENNYPKIVVIAEDQTRVWRKIRFDKQTNCLIGFVSPNAQNGLPAPLFFKVHTSKSIQQYFEKYEKASFVNLIVAQPLSPNAAGYCLAAYGSNNKFTHVDVKNRWMYIEEELASRNIIHLVNSGDGDPKLLKAMRIDSGLGKNSQTENRKWFLVSINF